MIIIPELDIRRAIGYYNADVAIKYIRENEVDCEIIMEEIAAGTNRVDILRLIRSDIKLTSLFEANNLRKALELCIRG